MKRNPQVFKRGRWEPNIFGKPGEYFEISIVHSDNTHGKRSYGWSGPDKLILSTSIQHYDGLPEPIWNDMLDLARKWAKIFSEPSPEH